MMLKLSFTEDSKCKFLSPKFEQVYYKKVFNLTFKNYLISNETLISTMVSFDCLINHFE